MTGFIYPKVIGIGAAVLPGPGPGAVTMAEWPPSPLRTCRGPKRNPFRWSLVSSRRALQIASPRLPLPVIVASSCRYRHTKTCFCSSKPPCCSVRIGHTPHRSFVLVRRIPQFQFISLSRTLLITANLHRHRGFLDIRSEVHATRRDCFRGAAMRHTMQWNLRAFGGHSLFQFYYILS